MFRKFALLLAALFVIPMALSACGSTPSPASEPQSLVGSWSADGFEALVTDHDITINLATDDTKGLYWTGTFPTPVNGTVTSTADREALDASLFGSGDATKNFSMKGENISFEFTIMGTTRTVTLTKVK